MRTLRDREIIEIGEVASLACVIDRLQTFQSRLGADSQADLKIDGNDHFGWRIIITYLRELLPEEAALEARYSLPRSARGKRS